MDEKKSCCFIGLNLRNLIYIFDEEVVQCIRLKQIIFSYIFDLIKHDPAINFVSDMSLGFGIVAAEIILSLKPVYPDITLVCALPYEEQAAHWTVNQRNKYYNMIEKCDKEIIFQKHYTRFCVETNQRNMIDYSAFVLALQNGNNIEKVLQYAESKNRQITLINPDELY
ncbi:MAG: SLOG family protein [Eubacteriales bacterium]